MFIHLDNIFYAEIDIMTAKARVKGFTLVETLLVMVVVSVLLVMSIKYSQQKVLNMQIDRAALQMQQILNAGLAYYVNHGTFPADLSILQTENYLPTGTIASPWGGSGYSVTSTNTMLTVKLVLPTGLGAGSTNIAQILVGKLPMANVVSYQAAVPGGQPPPGHAWCEAPADPIPCLPGSPEIPAGISASVNLPGQDLNNATAVNFAGVFHHGGCIPVPNCPADATGTVLTPQVFVVPVSVSGLADVGSLTNAYPISSFTAYAKGPAAQGELPVCDGQNMSSGEACGFSPSGNFWRACLNIITERGNVNGVNMTLWGQNVTLAAFTRCAVSTESSGSPLTVFSN